MDGSARRVARSKKRSAIHDVLLVFASLYVKLASRCPRVCRLLRELEGRPTNNFLAINSDLVRCFAALSTPPCVDECCRVRLRRLSVCVKHVNMLRKLPPSWLGSSATTDRMGQVLPVFAVRTDVPEEGIATMVGR